MDKIAVLIPCYNESKTVEKVVTDFRRVLPDATVYVYDNNSTDGTAELRVLVTTALGALPLENAIVSVSTVPDDTGMRTLLYSVTTDSGGMTPSMILTTPPRSNSLSPGSGPPFAVYTVEISAEGYTTLTALHIAMFSGVPTMLPVALTPLAENQSFAQTDLTATGAPQALDPELPENP